MTSSFKTSSSLISRIQHQHPPFCTPAYFFLSGQIAVESRLYPFFSVVTVCLAGRRESGVRFFKVSFATFLAFFVVRPRVFFFHASRGRFSAF